MITLKGKQFNSTSGSTQRQVGTNKGAKAKKDSFLSESNSGSKVNLSNLPITLDLDPLLYGIAEDSTQSRTTFTKLYKDIYYYDAICGAAVDLYSNLPFSEFTLGGISDAGVLEVFMENIERLNIRTLLNELSVDYLVTGTFLGSLLYNKDKKLFFDIMPHDIGNAEITPLPFYSQDPLIKVRFPKEVAAALNTPSRRIDQIREKLGPQVIDKLLSGSLELDPLGTLYLPRKTFANSEGTSYYKRILPYYLIEKNLFRGTLIESAKRQRGILHITVGDGDQWEPSLAEMESITDLFTNADADPLGAVITTRLGIATEELRCITGDAIISTDNGLIRIDEICDRISDQPHSRKVDLQVKGINGKFAEVDEWHYQGYKPVKTYYTDSGSQITCTVNHKFLTLTGDGDLRLKRIECVKKDDYLCLSLGGESVRSRLPLGLFYPEIEKRPSNIGLKIPQYMTPNLAWVIGFVLSDGYVNDGFVVVHNTNIDLIDKFYSIINQIFGLCGNIRQRRTSGKQEIRGKVYSIKNIYECQVNSKHLGLIFQQLGFKFAKDLNSVIPEDHRPCTYYEIPWCIMQADAESQLAFFAGYIDGDGSVVSNKDGKGNTVEIRFYSTSLDIINKQKIILANLGYHSKVVQGEYCIRLELATSDGSRLYNSIKKYIVSESKKPYDYCDTPVYRQYGIPPEMFIPLLESRFIRRTKSGSWFENDDGEPVLIEGGWKYLFRHYEHANSYLLYEGLDANAYLKELDVIQKVSNNLYNSIRLLQKFRYKFEHIMKVEDAGTQHVYDLSVKGNEEGQVPIICSNALVLSNSGGEFWKITDIIDQTTPYKLKAMGIPEGFVTGDATFNCVVGSTLIPTSEGLQRIDNICSKNNGNVQNIYFDVAARFGTERARKWVYSGEQRTITVTAESGNNITGTYKHRLLVLRDSVLSWQFLYDVKITDHICLSTHTLVRENTIKYCGKSVDEDVAYLIGCAMRKGYKVKDAIRLLLPEKVAIKFCAIYSQHFDAINFTKQKQKCLIEIEGSNVLFDKVVSNKNHIPWPILKTSTTAQLSFLAALVDLSTISKISFDSPSLGKELLVFVNSIGIMCDLKFNNLVIPQGESYSLYTKIKEYCAEEHAVKYEIRNWYGVPLDGKVVPYDDYDGDYEIKQNRYRFVKVLSIKESGVQPVYDLSMAPDNPSYVANGIVSHNTAETSLSVMIENMRAYRDTITRRLLYNKIFPLISVVNGFSVKNGKIIKSGKPHEIEDALDKLQDGSKLLIPVVHWNKQLKPEGDTAYLDLLDRMTAAGVPVPLRAMAAAGGFNLDELLYQQDDDITMREMMKAYTDKLAKFKAQQEEGGGGFGAMESSTLPFLDASPTGEYYSSVLSSRGKRNFLNRKYNGEITSVSKTGKKKFVADQVSANRRANSAIIKAVKSHASKNNTPLTKKTKTSPDGSD